MINQKGLSFEQQLFLIVAAKYPYEATSHQVNVDNFIKPRLKALKETWRRIQDEKSR